MDLGDVAPSLSALKELIDTTGVFPGLISPLTRDSLVVAVTVCTGASTTATGSSTAAVGTGTSLTLELLLRSPDL